MAPAMPCERLPSIVKKRAKPKIGNENAFKTMYDCIVVAPPGREQKSKPLLEGGHLAGLVNQPRNRECGTEERLHARDVDERMDEDKEETDNEEIRDEEEEEHQKARAIASP